MRLMGRAWKLVDECSRSARQPVRCGFNLVLLLKLGVRYSEFMELVCYLVFVQHVGDDILELIFMIAWSNTFSS